MTYVWQVEYRNGTTVNQFSNGQEISTETLLLDQVARMSLFDGDKCVLSTHLSSGQKLLYRRRTALGGATRQVCHLVGWRQCVRGEMRQSVAYCFEDGHIEITSDFNENHPWFYAPKFRADEW